MLQTQVLVPPAAVGLLGAEPGAALWAVANKNGEEEDGEDLEEEAQPGKPEPGGGGVLGHAAGQLEQGSAPKPGRHEEQPRWGCKLRLPGWLPGPALASVLPKGGRSRPRAGRRCQHGNPVVLLHRVAWAALLGLSVSASMGAGGAGWDFWGAGGSRGQGTPEVSAFLEVGHGGEGDGFWGSGQVEEGDAASTVGLTRCRGAGVWQA